MPQASGPEKKGKQAIPTDRRSTEADLRRADLARKLFAAWTGVTNPDLLAGLWNNLNAVDRRYWLESADQQLEEGATRGPELRPG